MTDLTTLPELVLARALRTPDRPALTSVEQGTVSWRELRDASYRWASWLRQHGVGRGDRVVTLVPQSLEASYVWLACAALGAVEVSVNTAFRGEWMRHALAVSSAKVIVLSSRYLAQVTAVLPETGVTTVLVYDAEDGDDDDRPSEMPATAPPDLVPTHAHDLACVLYTSGTTGASKAVQISWRQLALTLDVDPAFARPEGQVFYLPYAPYHLSGRCALYRGARAGGHTVVRESFSTSSFWSDVRRFGVTWTILYAAPTRFVMGLEPRPDDADNPLEWVLMCPLLPEVDALKRRFGTQVYSVFGMTEIGNPLLVAPEDAVAAKAGCCGRPIEGVEAQLVDEHDYPVAPGESGELVLRSREPWCFTSGYQGAPEATARAWRNGWFHTGDRMRTGADGLFYYVDRAKDMIRRRGENVSSVELEAAVARHPQVAEVAAVGVASAVGDEDILVVVVPRAATALDPVDLLAYLRDVVPRFALPRYVRQLSALPRTQATQRVEKHLLRAAGVTADTWDGQRDASQSKTSV